MLFKTILCTLIQLFGAVSSARILGIVPTPSYSHQVVFHPLWKQLVSRGHQLTVLTTDPINDSSLTNLTEIDLHFSYEFWNKHISQVMKSNSSNPMAAIDTYFNTMIGTIDLQLQHPEVQTLNQNQSEHFDLLIVEHLVPVMLAFGERFKCPIITMITIDAPSGILKVMGNPVHPVLNPDISLSYLGELSFFERFTSVLFQNLVPFLVSKYVSSMQDVVHKHFGPNFPHYQDIQHNNISLLFINSNFALQPIRALVPAIIQIGGGIHMKPLKPLPQELTKFLDGAKDGFIYFSLGTNVKSGDLSDEILDKILQAFSELPYRVLWKFDSNSLPRKPANVMISTWLPQQDVLRHPKIKLFITQGGIQSTEEAIYSRVPILGIPFAGDQSFNIKLIVQKGCGLSIDNKNLQKEDFKSKILEVAENLKYRNNVDQLADLIVDQPMTGLEKAVWWTEYVIRHKGAKYLRSPVLDLPSYQYYLLDVIGFLVAISALVLFVIVKAVQIFVRLLKYCFKSKVKSD